MKSLKRFLATTWWSTVISSVIEITGRWRFANGITTNDVYADHVSGFYATESGVRKKVLTENTIIDQDVASRNINMALRSIGIPNCFSQFLGSASGIMEDWGEGMVFTDKTSQLGLRSRVGNQYREVIVNTDREDEFYYGAIRDWGVLKSETGAGSYKAGLIFPVRNNSNAHCYIGYSSSAGPMPALQVLKDGAMWIGGTRQDSLDFGTYLKFREANETSVGRNRMTFGFDSNIDAFDFRYDTSKAAFVMESLGQHNNWPVLYTYAQFDNEAGGLPSFSHPNTVAPQGAIYNRVLAAAQRGFLSFSRLSNNTAPAGPFERGLLYVSQDAAIAWLALGPQQLHEVPLNQDTLYFNISDRKLYTYSGSELVEYVPGTAAVSWESVTGKPSVFPPAEHSHTIEDVTGLRGELDSKIEWIGPFDAAISTGGKVPFSASETHWQGGGLDVQVDAAGASLVRRTSAGQVRTTPAVNANDAVNLGQITPALAGKADLVDGKVPVSQLPSYVSDVIIVGDYSLLPAVGEASKIYVTEDENKTYRWTGSAYVEIGDGGVVLGETSATAYRGDRGKIAYDHSQLTSGNPHNTEIGDITGLQDELDGKLEAVLPSTIGLTVINQMAFRSSGDTWQYVTVNTALSNNTVVRRTAAGAVFGATATVGDHLVPLQQLTPLLSNKADLIHTHVVSDIEDLQDELDSKLEQVTPADLNVTVVSSQNRVPIVSNGVFTSNGFVVNESTLGGTIAIRTSSGTLRASAATAGNDLVNLTQLNTVLSALSAEDVGAVEANAAITAGTATKVTYDSKGLITAGDTLVAADIPNLNVDKITTGRFPFTRLPWGASGNFLKAAGPGSPSYEPITVSDIPDLPASKITSGTNTAFNKNFGTAADTVAEGNHNHDDRYVKKSRFSGTYNPTVTPQILHVVPDISSQVGFVTMFARKLSGSSAHVVGRAMSLWAPYFINTNTALAEISHELTGKNENSGPGIGFQKPSISILDGDLQIALRSTSGDVFEDDIWEYEVVFMPMSELV